MCSTYRCSVRTLGQFERIWSTFRSADVSSHAQNKIVGQIIPFLVKGFRDKNTMASTDAMVFRRNVPATTRILSFQAKHGIFCLQCHSSRCEDEAGCTCSTQVGMISRLRHAVEQRLSFYNLNCCHLAPDVRGGFLRWGHKTNRTSNINVFLVTLRTH